jgi:uncharacterized cupin superfamily protein
MERTPGGLRPSGEGWFLVNARDAVWFHSDTFGAATTFEGTTRFTELGININVLRPGQPNGYYHAEDDQEDFLVVAGECLLLVEGEERRLRAWDFVHCPPGTEHIFVAAGDGPCVFVAVGSRSDNGSIVYPRSDLALGHGAGVAEETNDPRQAYDGTGEIVRAPYAGGLPPA